MVRLKCLLGGKDTIMVDWSLYNDGNGCRGGIVNTSRPAKRTVLYEHTFEELLIIKYVGLWVASKRICITECHQNNNAKTNG